MFHWPSVILGFAAGVLLVQAEQGGLARWAKRRETTRCRALAAANQRRAHE